MAFCMCWSLFLSFVLIEDDVLTSLEWQITSSIIGTLGDPLIKPAGDERGVYLNVGTGKGTTGEIGVRDSGGASLE